MTADRWLTGGLPSRRCGRDIDTVSGETRACSAPVFVDYIIALVARYVCINPKCTRYSAHAESRYRKGCEA